MPVTLLRLYKGTDTGMLLAVSTILISVVSYAVELASKYNLCSGERV